jgi:hypothetical protein
VATRVFSEEELERLRGFGEINPRGDGPVLQMVPRRMLPEPQPRARERRGTRRCSTANS